MKILELSDFQEELVRQQEEKLRAREQKRLRDRELQRIREREKERRQKAKHRQIEEQKRNNQYYINFQIIIKKWLQKALQRLSCKKVYRK